MSGPPLQPSSGGEGAPAQSPPAGPVHPSQAHWSQKMAAVLFCVFIFELGLFLLVYPWLELWNRNYLFEVFPAAREFMLSQHVRGAVSGLGILNLFIAVSETIRLRRFSDGG